MPVLLLHIGPHKTGSTYLQKKILDQREWLRAQGWTYPESGQEVLWGHHRLVRALQNGDGAPIEALREELDGLRKAGRSVLMSSENFERLDEEQCAGLARALEGFDVRVVYYARRWAGILYGAWQGRVKHGGSELFPEFALEHLGRPFDSALLNYAIPVGRFEKAFGRGAVKVVSYDNLRAQGRDIFEHLVAELLGLAPQPVTPETINPSWEPQDVELLRALNALHYLRTGKRSVRVRHNLRSALKAVGKPAKTALLERIAAERLHYEVAPDVFGATVRAFEEGFRHCLLNPAPGGGLFAPGEDKKIEYCGHAYLLDPGPHQQIHDLYAAMGAMKKKEKREKRENRPQ